MPSYTLEIEAFGFFTTNTPSLEIWEDGVLDSTHPVLSTGSVISVTINYGGTIPTSLEFTFNDGFAAAGRSIEIRSVKINDQFVNTNNYLSDDSLSFGQTATVDINDANTNDSDFLFDNSEPLGTEFTVGATRTFTAGTDRFSNHSSATPETFDMLGGRDIAYLGSGDDKVNGGAGNDILRGGAGDDLLYGGADDDNIDGGADNDMLYGGSGNDRLKGGTGNDEIHGGIGNDSLNGNGGDDVITGGAGEDKLNGSSGTDFLYGGSENDILVGGSGDDTLDGGSGDDLLYGGADNDVLNGGDDNDVLIGNTGADVIHGDGGNDTIYLMQNDFVAGEQIYGGSGTDELILSRGMTIDLTSGVVDGIETLTGSQDDQDVTYSIEQALAFTTIDLGNGTDTTRVNIAGTIDVTALGTPTVSNVENSFLTGSTGDDDITLSGDQLNALVFGTGTINLNNGTDTINLTSPSAAFSTVVGTDGSLSGVEVINTSVSASFIALNLISQTEDITFIGSAFGDTLTLGSGDDTINGGDGDDLIIGFTGADIIDAGDGNDTIDIGNGEFAVGESIDGGIGTDEITIFNATTVDFTTGTVTGVETLTGSTGNDDITLSVTQFFSLDTIDYAGGTDSQTISVAGTHDVTGLTAPSVSGLEASSIIFSTGADELTITGSQLDAFTTGLTTLNTLGGADVLNITSTSTNLIAYGASNTNLQGLETITANGATGDVVISVSGQSEGFTLGGGDFNDTITGGAAVDNISGGDGDDILTGLDGADIINGGDGNDTILGGDGNDIITGGDGDDTIFGATIIGESGVETVIQTDSTTWHSVTFSAAILNPVVKMSNMTNNDGDFYVVRVRDVTETGFEWQIDEFDYLDGSRILAEDVSWIAIAEGTHTLDNGSVIQAGTTTATNEGFTNITFDSAFGTAPVVMTQIMSDNDSAAAGTRNRSRTTTGFQVQMLEEEIADGTHATEDIGWIAIDNGGSVGSGFLVGETTDSVTHVVTTVTFPTAFDNTPVVLHDQQTRDGGDTSYSQADGITTGDARFFVGEEQSRDTEVNHTTEVIGYYALNEGLITSADGGDNTFTGGAGVDTLFGGDGADTFIFEAANAFTDNDILADFSTGEDDVLDISDLITGAFSGTITDYLFLDDTSGTDTVIRVDAAGTGSSYLSVATINGITGLDEATLFADGNVVV